MKLEEIELYGKSGNDIRPDRVTLKIEEFDFLVEEIKELRRNRTWDKFSDIYFFGDE